MSAVIEARKRWLASRGNPHQPTFTEAFDGGYQSGIESAWAAAEELIEKCSGVDQSVTAGGLLEAFAEARHDLRGNVAELDRRHSQKVEGP